MAGATARVALDPVIYDGASSASHSAGAAKAMPGARLDDRGPDAAGNAALE